MPDAQPVILSISSFQSNHVPCRAHKLSKKPLPQPTASQRILCSCGATPSMLAVQQQTFNAGFVAHQCCLPSRLLNGNGKLSAPGACVALVSCSRPSACISFVENPGRHCQPGQRSPAPNIGPVGKISARSWGSPAPRPMRHGALLQKSVRVSAAWTSAAKYITRYFLPARNSALCFGTSEVTLIAALPRREAHQNRPLYAFVKPVYLRKVVRGSCPA